MKIKHTTQTIAALALTTMTSNAAVYALYDGSLADKDPTSQGWTEESVGGVSDSMAAADGWLLDDRTNDNHLPRWTISLSTAQLNDLVTNGGTISFDITSVAGGGFLSLGFNNNVPTGELFGVPITPDHYRSGQSASTGIVTWTFAAGGATAPAEAGWSGTNAAYAGAEDALQIQFESGSSTGDANAFIIHNVTLTTVPEPTSTALLGLGGLALILRRRK